MKKLLSHQLKYYYVVMILALAMHGCTVVKKVETDTGSGTIGSIVDLSGILKAPEPITTNFSDTKLDNSLPDNFGDDMKPRSLIAQPRSANNGFLLAPGFYEMNCRSYCLHAGTYGPSKGDGYLYAPLKGPKMNIIQAIVRNSAIKNNIPQSTIQLLIWAVLAQTNFSYLSPDLKLASLQLLSPEQLLELNGGALSLIPESDIEKATAALPESVRQAIIAQNKMRQLFQQAGTSYEDVERISVLTGIAPGSKEYKQGSWSKHPNGYFVRYFPSGYQLTRVQVYVPANKDVTTAMHGGPVWASNASFQEGAPVEYDATGNVAVPANTGAQRLQQSNEPPPGNGCSGWESDPESMSIRAAESFCNDAFNTPVSSPISANCSGNVCVVRFSGSIQDTITITVDLSHLPGMVYVSGKGVYYMKSQACSYTYSCSPSGAITFKRIVCKVM
jgi:hypothetical protein